MTAINISSAARPEPLPLAGKRILITRAPHQASELAERLSALGAEAILIPTIEIGPPASVAPLDAAILSLRTFDLVVFTSANAVRALKQRSDLAGVNPAPKRIAVVGPATERALKEIGLTADILPPMFTAESLAQTLLPEARNRRILLVLAEHAPAILESALKSAGAQVTAAAAYANHIPATSLLAITSLFADPLKVPDAVTFTSASTAINLVTLLDAAHLVLPSAVTRASIGPVTSRALVELGMPPHVEAAESTIPALVSAVSSYLRVAP